MNNRLETIVTELKKVIGGKDEILGKVLMAVLAGGHVLLEDVPGVGKTTLVLALSKSMGLDYKRVQCTPDVLPSDIVGFSVYNKEKDMLEYKPGAVMCNLFLVDEINRTSSKTQSALLEAMQEGNVTIDGITHDMPQPFTVIATQNPLGSAGTQSLPEAQLDRFIMKLGMGYPSYEAQIEILENRLKEDPLLHVENVVTAAELTEMQKETNDVYVKRDLLCYITSLCEATREHEWVRLGVSPRGVLAMVNMTKAHAYYSGRNYAVPEDVIEVFLDTCAHRLVLSSKARINNATAKDILEQILKDVKIPEFKQGE